MNKIYFDLDGVFADFDNEPNALERFAIEKGFFKNLKQLPLLDTVKKLIDRQELDINKLYILSASPTKIADSDKIKWLENNLPQIKKENIILVRSGLDKAKYAKGNLLIDDYSNNLIEWERCGGFGLKVATPQSKGLKWKGHRILV
jgi:5'(3')-deoxyribonucleotidase